MIHIVSSFVLQQVLCRSTYGSCHSFSAVIRDVELRRISSLPKNLISPENCLKEIMLQSSINSKDKNSCWFQIKCHIRQIFKDKHNFLHSSCQNENISFAIYLYSYKV